MSTDERFATPGRAPDNVKISIRDSVELVAAELLAAYEQHGCPL